MARRSKRVHENIPSKNREVKPVREFSGFLPPYYIFGENHIDTKLLRELYPMFLADCGIISSWAVFSLSVKVRKTH
jgi:hypothetical protein